MLVSEVGWVGLGRVVCLCGLVVWFGWVVRLGGWVGNWGWVGCWVGWVGWVGGWVGCWVALGRLVGSFGCWGVGSSAGWVGSWVVGFYVRRFGKGYWVLGRVLCWLCWVVGLGVG